MRKAILQIPMMLDLSQRIILKAKVLKKGGIGHTTQKEEGKFI